MTLHPAQAPHCQTGASAENPGRCQLYEAKVFSVLEDMFFVTSPAGLCKARRAASCLLLPAPGDTVLISLSAASCHILAVLVQKENEGCLQLPKTCTVQAEDLSLEAGRELRLTGAGLSAEARHVTVRATLCRLLGLRLEQRFETVHTKAGHLCAMAGRALSFFGRSLQKVDGLCETEAGRMRLTSKESLRVRSDSLDMRSKNSVVLDGEHITIG